MCVFSLIVLCCPCSLEFLNLLYCTPPRCMWTLLHCMYTVLYEFCSIIVYCNLTVRYCAYVMTVSWGPKRYGMLGELWVESGLILGQSHAHLHCAFIKCALALRKLHVSDQVLIVAGLPRYVLFKNHQYYCRGVANMIFSGITKKHSFAHIAT